MFADCCGKNPSSPHARICRLWRRNCRPQLGLTSAKLLTDAPTAAAYGSQDQYASSAQVKESVRHSQHSTENSRELISEESKGGMTAGQCVKLLGQSPDCELTRAVLPHYKLRSCFMLRHFESQGQSVDDCVQPALVVKHSTRPQVSNEVSFGVSLAVFRQYHEAVP